MLIETLCPIAPHNRSKSIIYLLERTLDPLGILVIVILTAILMKNS